MLADPGGKAVPLQITEDEAAVYDRQIRLWGLEAQQRMRNATIFVANLKGVATETIKNIVLAGIGKLIVWDSGSVQGEDLGTGFFFTDEDVGELRVVAGRRRIEALNPLVAIETRSSTDLFDDLDLFLPQVDLVCITDTDRETLIRVNDACRQHKKPFYAGGTYGLIGYIFCDLIDHEYLAPDRSDSQDSNKKIKKAVSYCPLRSALRPYKWSSLNRVQTKDLNPSAVFSLLALWEFQARHQGILPDDESYADELISTAESIFSEADINKRVLKSMPTDIVRNLSTTAAHEFSPVCAVVGGLLAQDMLKMLAAQDPPIANLFVFDGNTGHGSVCRMNM